LRTDTEFATEWAIPETAPDADMDEDKAGEAQSWRPEYIIQTALVEFPTEWVIPDSTEETGRTGT
jgi:hypothetical protein